MPRFSPPLGRASGTAEAIPCRIRTKPAAAPEKTHKSPRQKAWHNTCMYRQYSMELKALTSKKWHLQVLVEITMEK